MQAAKYPDTPRICASIAENSVEKALARGREMEGLANVLEIRLDSLPSPEVSPFLQELPLPLLFTNRPQWEGGHFLGGEEERLQPLLAAIDQGASFVDIELRAGRDRKERIIAAARGTKTRTIISWHNFQDTPRPEELRTILRQQRESGADIGKMVTMAHNFTDVLDVLCLQKTAHETGFPLIAFCMGEAGRISRLATLELGGFMTYAAPGPEENTAPGQLTVDEIRQGLSIIEP